MVTVTDPALPPSPPQALSDNGAFIFTMSILIIVGLVCSFHSFVLYAGETLASLVGAPILHSPPFSSAKVISPSGCSGYSALWCYFRVYNKKTAPADLFLTWWSPLRPNCHVSAGT